MPLINNVINGIKNLAKPAASAATKIPDPPMPKAPNPWKKRAVKGTAAGLGIGLAGGYVGHSLFKAPEPPVPQYDGYRQTAGAIEEGVAKTAHKEDGTMDLMGRLSKTAEEAEEQQKAPMSPVKKGAIIGGAINGGLGTLINVASPLMNAQALREVGMSPGKMALGGGLFGATAGTALGAGVGAGIGAIVKGKHKDPEEQLASEQLDRLAKTANDMEVVQAISEITGAPPEQIVNLMQNNPQEFAELVQELQGDQGGEPLSPVGNAAATGAGIGAGAGSLAGGIGGTILGAEHGFGLGAMRGGSAPVRLAKGVLGGLAGGVTGGLGGAGVGGLLGTGIGGLVGAGVGGVKQLFGGNPRQGAGSVSDAPAGVDKSASANDDAMIQRLEKTLDAAMDVGNAYRAGEAKKEQQEKSAAELMAALEKTANELSVPILEALAQKRGVSPEEILAQFQQAAGPAAEGILGKARGYVGNIADQAGDLASRIGNGARDLYGQASGAVGNALSQAKGYATGAVDHVGDYASNPQNLKQLGAYGGTALGGAALGAGGMALANQGDDEEQVASADYAELDKAANVLSGALTKAKGLFDTGAGHVKKYIGDVSGKNVEKAQSNLAFHKTPAGENAMYNAGLNDDGMHQHLNQLSNNITKAQADQKKAIKGTAIAAGTGLAGLGTGVAINKGRDKQASEEDLDPANHTTPNDPATAEGPAGQVGLEGYSESGLPKEEEKEADEKADFMNELFKEAAAHILTMDVPKVKAYVDPMSRIKF